MRLKLFEVEDNFSFIGREGTIVIGRLEEKSPSFKNGDEVVFILPNGKEMEAIVSGIETKPLNLEKIGVWFKTLTKEDIPIGTEVFSKKSRDENFHHGFSFL